MSYFKFFNLISNKCPDVRQQDLKQMWNVYQLFIDNPQWGGEVMVHHTVLIDLLVYTRKYLDSFTDAQYKELITLLIIVYERVNDYTLNSFDHSVIDDITLEIYDYVGHYETSVCTDEIHDIWKNYGKMMIQKRKEAYYSETNVNECFYEEIISVLDGEKEQINRLVDQGLEIYQRLVQILKEEKIPKYLIKASVISTYVREKDNPLSYQQRLNFVLGFIQPEQETLYHQAMFLVEYYNNLMIPKKYKDLYFLQGYFHSFEPYSENYECQDVEYLNGKDYFSDCMNDNKMEVLVENVNDYFHDLNHKNKNVMFLYGLLTKGTQLYEQSVEKQEKTLYYS